MEFGHMFETVVIDPAKVTRPALQDAASVAGLLLTTEAAVVLKPDKARSLGTMSGGMSGIT